MTEPYFVVRAKNKSNQRVPVKIQASSRAIAMALGQRLVNTRQEVVSFTVAQVGERR